MITAIHITHEARAKMGGIGAVLEGLITAEPYQRVVDRTLLVGTAELPLEDPPPDLVSVQYESNGAGPGPGRSETAVAPLLRGIERAYGVRVFYGQRALTGPLGGRRAVVDLLLLDVRQAHAAPVSNLKGELFGRFGLRSDRFEHDWAYEEWVRVAMPALGAVGAYLGHSTDGAVLVSHEFMGLPALLAARIHVPDLRTVYWAHEVPPVRDLIESRPDHRLRFDLALGTEAGRRAYEDLLREETTFKHALVSRAHAAHAVFAVSDRVADELRLLGPAFRATPVEIVYNGLPAHGADLGQCQASRRLLLDYAEALVGFRPDFLFTHVTRPVVSKAIGRDLAVLEQMDPLLGKRGRTAVLLVLATDGGRRDPDLVCRMEREYGWPLFHRVGWPDLVKGEVEVGLAVQRHNEAARATRAVLINQFGFRPYDCGNRVPAGLALADLRRGSDVEFGQSTYEPFGISPLEVLAFGGISVITRSCGCTRLLERLTGNRLPANVLIADYAAPLASVAEAARDADADRVEREVAGAVARELLERLPTDPAGFARLLEAGAHLAEQMSWRAVCEDHFLPALERCLGLKRPPRLQPVPLVH